MVGLVDHEEVFLDHGSDTEESVCSSYTEAWEERNHLFVMYGKVASSRQ